MNNVLELLNHEIEDEWSRLIKEFATVSRDEFRWQPGSRLHSIGWHVRHAIEWRYALVHVWIAGHSAEEKLCCLGWEKEPLVQNISVNRGWYEPHFTPAETLEFLEWVRRQTRQDLALISQTRYSDILTFPWRTNSVFHEIMQDVRHSALHRGHIRQLKKMIAEQYGANAVLRTREQVQPTPSSFPLQ